MASDDYQIELQLDRDRICTSVRERYAQITAKLASDLLDQFRTSNIAVLESKAAPPKIAPSTITKTRDIGVQTEPESIPLSKRGSSSGTAVEGVSSIVNLQNAVAQLQAQLARYEAELVRAHSTARALEANLHQREARVRKLEAEYDKLRAEKDMYLWKVFHLEIGHGTDAQTLQNANAEVERLREEIRNFHLPSSQLYQSIKNAVERNAKGLPPLSPETPFITIHENTTILDAHVETTTMPPPPPRDTHMSSSSQPTSQQSNRPVTPTMTTQNSRQYAISIPKGPVHPGPLSAPAVMSSPKPMYVSPIDGNHLPQHQYQVHRMPKRTATVPVSTNGAHSHGHITNYFRSTTHQIPHQIPVNRTVPMPISQPPQSQPQATNRSVSSANPTPQPAEGQRHSMAIPVHCGDPLATSIFSGLWKAEYDGGHQFVGSGCKGCHMRLGKDQLLNYQIAFEHSANAHSEEWHRCCQWALARAGERARQHQHQQQRHQQTQQPQQ